MGCLSGKVINEHGFVLIVMVVPWSGIAKGGNVKRLVFHMGIHDGSCLPKSSITDVEDDLQLLRSHRPGDQGESLIKMMVSSNDTWIFIDQVALPLRPRSNSYSKILDIISLARFGGSHLAKLDRQVPRLPGVILLTVLASLLGSPSALLDMDSVRTKQLLDLSETETSLELAIALIVLGTVGADLPLID